MRDDVSADAAPPTPETPKRRLWLHFLLFFLTLGTTTQVGLLSSDAYQLQAADPTFTWYLSVEVWLDAFSYSLGLLGILFAHEMGHYVTARRRGVDVSLPYFLPMFSAFGTLGAFIRMRLGRQVPGDDLIRIGAYGPIAGFIVAVPVLIIGLMLSNVAPTPEDLQAGITLGDSLLLSGMTEVLFPNIPEGYDVWLHPMAYAGWAGMFVTALNLLPIGQLDGGHIVYCMLGGKRFNRIAPVLFVGLLALTLFVFPGWLMLCVLIILIGVGHPPISGDLPVRGKSRLVGLVCAILFVLTFTPVPFGGFPPLIELFQ